MFLLIFMMMFLCACTGSVINSSAPVPINMHDRMAVLPFSNHTETPLAGERAKSITAALLESKCVYNLAVYQNHYQGRILFPGMNKVDSQRALLRWARRVHARYVMTGSVNEWSYKVGLDGEPVVGVSMQLIDLCAGQIIWTSVGSMSGGSRTAVSTLAQDLMNTMLNGLFCHRCRHGR